MALRVSVYKKKTIRADRANVARADSSRMHSTSAVQSFPRISHIHGKLVRVRESSTRGVCF